MADNTRVLLSRRPAGPVGADCFTVDTVPAAEPDHGDVLVRVIYVSVDPYIRGRMERPSGYAGSFELGAPIPARAVGQVVASRHPAWHEGDFVWGFLGWQTLALVTRGEGLYPVDPALGPLSQFISVLGMPGLTVWVGMVDIGRPRPGDTVVVSSAAGAVGSLAGQLARLAGARVVGIAGSLEKCRHVVDTLRFDDCVSYRSPTPLADALRDACPNGIDVYFENVGGAVLEAALANLAPFARIPVCGMISGYDTGEEVGPRNIHALPGARATMTGFIIYDHMDQYAAYAPRMASLLQSGAVVYVEDIQEGIEQVPGAFIGMLHGDSIGKRLVRVGDDPTR